MTDEIPNKDRRQYPRFPSAFQVSYGLLYPLRVTVSAEGMDEYPAMATDISQGGVGLTVEQSLAVGLTVKLRFELINGRATSNEYRRRSFELNGEVRHCEARDPRFHVGVQFLQATLEELDFIATYIKDQNLLQK